MKFLITSFLLLFNSYIFSQSELDCFTFIKINQYRSSKNLSNFEFSENTKNASYHQSNYIYKKFISLQSDEEDTLLNTSDRLKFYDVNFNNCAENVLLINNLIIKSNDLDINDKISNLILNFWTKSPIHNNKLLGDYKYAAISSFIHIEDLYFNNYINIKLTSTIIMFN
jgi:uncharacterized protein YkwD